MMVIMVDSLLPLVVAACAGDRPGPLAPGSSSPGASSSESASVVAPAARPGSPDAEALEAANANLARFLDSWNRADGEAYGENYWPEAELVDPVGGIFEGRAAIVQTHVELWAGPFKGSTQTGTVRAVHRLASNVVVVDLDVHLSGGKPPPGSQLDARGRINCHLKHVLEKRDGVWRTLLAQNTFVQPP
jgi:uncharacterized protein (TIGR02246 family)